MSSDTSIAANAIAITQKWVRTVIVDQHFCPFAQREVERESVRYVVLEDQSIEGMLEELMLEVNRLDNDKKIETTLLIMPESFKDFESYLDFVDIANQLMISEGCEGHYQLASFHPDYCFDGEEYNDAANYTNRSPYPMLHLLRESSLEKALSHVDNPEDIPERNIEHARSLGVEVMRHNLERCFKK